MRVLVCGGRYHDDVDGIHHDLIGFHRRTPITVIIHGGVSGAGAIAEAWARRNHVAVVRYPPNWECLGKRAEKFRNDFMLRDSRPDIVIAFPGGPDTADLVAKATAAGIEVLRAAGRNNVDVPGPIGARQCADQRTVPAMR